MFDNNFHQRLVELGYIGPLNEAYDKWLDVEVGTEGTINDRLKTYFGTSTLSDARGLMNDIITNGFPNLTVIQSIGALQRIV